MNWVNVGKGWHKKRNDVKIVREKDENRKAGDSRRFLYLQIRGRAGEIKNGTEVKKRKWVGC